MMADRQSTSEDDEILITADAKIFLKEDMLLGFCGLYSDAQAVRHRFEFPERAHKEEAAAYLYSKWLPAYREFMNAERRVVTPDEKSRRELSDTYGMLALEGALFLLTSDFAALPIAAEFLAIGSGGPYARGALYALRTRNPKVKLTCALEIAAQCSSSVSGPFDYLFLPNP